MRGHFLKFIYLAFSLLQQKNHSLITRHRQQSCCYVTSPPPATRRIFNAKCFITPPCCIRASYPAGTGRSLWRDVAGSSALRGPAASRCSQQQWDCSDEQAALLCQSPWYRTFGIRTHKMAPLKTKPAEIQGCEYPIILSSPLYTVCWIVKRYQKIVPVIQQQISDTQKQNIKAAA